MIDDNVRNLCNLGLLRRILNYIFHFQIDETFSQERINAVANARSEIASLQVRIDGLTSQVRHAIIFNSIEVEVKVRRQS